MTDRPDCLIPEARDFLAALHADNSRDWFLAHKADYDSRLKAPAEALLAELAPTIARIAGCPVVPKLFRPQRDVRFSKDKTPYTTHLHMMWTLDAGARQNPVFFFGIGLDYITAGAGLMGLDKPVLEDWRKWVDLDSDRIGGILGGLEAAGYRMRAPELKRVPPPYPQDHPAARLLRMKAVTASRELAADARLPDDLEAAFAAAWPLNALLVQVASRD